MAPRAGRARRGGAGEDQGEGVGAALEIGQGEGARLVAVRMVDPLGHAPRAGGPHGLRHRGRGVGASSVASSLRGDGPGTFNGGSGARL